MCWQHCQLNDHSHCPGGALLNAFVITQGEVPSSVRAFWETGASHPGGLSTSVSMDSNRVAGERALPLRQG